MSDEPVFTPTSWPPQPGRLGPDYSQLVVSLKEGKIVHVEHRTDCNCAYSLYVKTVEQLDEVIAFVFSRERAEHEAFFELQRSGPPVCDGLIFGTTRGLLSKAISTSIAEDCYDYIRAFTFLCSGTFVTILDETPAEVGTRLHQYSLQYGLKKMTLK